MRLHDVSPSPLLATFVESYWYVEASADESSVVPDAILPNGTSNLIFNLSGFPHREYRDETCTHFYSLNERWLSSVHEAAIIVGPTVSTRVVGIRFKPGGLIAFSRISSAEFAGLTIDPDDLWGSDCRRLHEQLFEATGVAEKFALLDDWLLTRVDLDAAHKGLQKSLALLDVMTGNVSITQLARVADLSGRQYRRRFEQAVGITPKKLARILRFRKLIDRLVPTDAAPDWVGASCECGYFDQAHLIGDFREFAGVSPGEYLRRRPLVPGFMPVNASMSVFSNTGKADSTRIVVS